MAKYHVNPETGQVGLCRAQVRCRFQRTGAPAVEHYASRDEGQAAYERSQARPLPPAARPPAENLAATYPPLTQAFQEELVRDAQALVEGFLQEGVYLPPRSAADLPAEGFIYLGEGVHNTAYLNSSATLVYKVMNNFQFTINQALRKDDYLQASLREKVPALLRDHERETEEAQQRYAELSTELLREEGAEYVPTYFLPVAAGEERMTVVVQPYLDDSEYETLPEEDWEEDYDADGSLEEQGELTNEKIYQRYDRLGVRDIHPGNYRVRLSDGVVVFFDCW